MRAESSRIERLESRVTVMSDNHPHQVRTTTSKTEVSALPPLVATRHNDPFRPVFITVDADMQPVIPSKRS